MYNKLIVNLLSPSTIFTHEDSFNSMNHLQQFTLRFWLTFNVAPIVNDEKLKNKVNHEMQG